MDVYLAARFGRRVELRAVARQLREAGINVTSRWLEREADDRFVSLEALGVAAEENAFDVYRAQVVIAFTEDPNLDPVTGGLRGGRHVEFGMAIAQRKRVILVGPHENVFHHLESVRQFDQAADAIAYVIHLAAESRA